MSMISDFATENYLKTIVKALSESGKNRLGTGELSRLLKVTQGSATVMVKKLEREGYLEYESHQGCSLTEKGRVYGLKILRRHRILETFLAQTLHLDWSEVHEEAENLEHATSDRLIDIIDAHLCHPSRDPHGDLIPSKAQKEYSVHDISLTSCAPGDCLRIVRIDGDKSSLDYCLREGLLPQVELRILTKNADSGLLTLSFANHESSFAISALEGVFVEAWVGEVSP